MAYAATRTVSGTADTPTTSDDGGLVQYTNASGKTITLSGTSWVAGRSAFAARISGGGTATFVGAAGVTVNGDTSIASGQTVVCQYTASNTWEIVGTDVLPVASGGTGATTAAGARAALSAERATRVNVLDHGATGNGTTDDRAAIIAADAAAGATGEVFFPPGVYRITSRLLNPVAARWVGREATILQSASVTSFVSVELVAAAGGTATEFVGLEFDGNKANNTDPGADTSGSGIYSFRVPITVRDCAFRNFHRLGVRASGTLTGATGPDDAEDFPTYIENVTIDDCDEGGVWLFTLADAVLDNVKVNGSPGTGGGIRIDRCDRVSLIDCEGNTCGSGINILYSRDTTVSGGRVHDNTQLGVAVGGGEPTYAPSTNTKIEGLTATNNGYSGISIDPTLSSALDTVVECPVTIVGCVSSGNAHHGIYLQHVSGAAVAGNVCDDNGIAGIAGVMGAASITGNVCRRNGTRGVELYANASSATLGPVVIEGNAMAGNTSGNGVGVSGFYTNVLVQSLPGPSVLLGQSVSTAGTNNVYAGYFAASAATGSGNVAVGAVSAIAAGVSNAAALGFAATVNHGGSLGSVAFPNVTTTATNQIKAGGRHVELDEISDPAAGATNSARLYVRDNGSGKTQLCVRFATGAVQVIATEP